MSFSTLQFNHTQLRRGNQRLCADLNLTVEAGELLEITGVNGSGKTSLLRLAVGLGDADAGEIIWQGNGSDEDDANAKLIYLAYKPELTPELSVFENLAFYCKLRQVQGHTIEDALGYFEISHLINTPCSQLSEGQCRRVALCRLLTEPVSWWFLDEPEAALDQSAVVLFENLLDQHLARGNGAVIATHRRLRPASARVKSLELPC